MALSDVAKRKLGTAMASALDANEITAALDAITVAVTTGPLGFFGATPVTQPAGASQAAATQTQTVLTDSSGGVVSTTLAAITAPAANVTTSLTADMTAAKNAIASMAAELALVKADVAALLALANAQRTALVALGLIKGAA